MMNFFSVAAGVALGIVLACAASVGFRAFFWPPHRDETDAPRKRSGLMVLTDYGTGVQYVVTATGGVAVRVDAKGKPVTQKMEES